MAVALDPSHLTASLHAEPVAPTARAIVVYRPGSDEAYLMATDLPATPAGSVYQLWIADAGGIAVIAHPGRYRVSANEEWALFQEFKVHGGRAVEVQTASHGDADVAKYGALAREQGLLASRGSDFHSPGESRIDLGALPALPAGLTPVWRELQSRIARAA